MRIILRRYDGYLHEYPVYMTTLEMMFLIFAVFLVIPVGLFFLLLSVGNFMYGDFLVGVVTFVFFIVCAGAVYYLIQKYRE